MTRRRLATFLVLWPVALLGAAGLYGLALGLRDGNPAAYLLLVAAVAVVSVASGWSMLTPDKPAPDPSCERCGGVGFLETAFGSDYDCPRCRPPARSRGAGGTP